MAALQMSDRSIPLRNAIEEATALVKWAFTVCGRGVWARSYASQIVETIYLEIVWDVTADPLE